jgi:PAS domain S-box-containing protein
VAGKAGLELAFVHPSATAVWPPSGIALAAVLLLGFGVWPALFVGAFAVNMTVAGDLPSSLGIALGNTLEALVGAWLVDRFAGGPRAFERPESVFSFVALAGLAATTLAAAIGVTSLCLAGLAEWSRWSAIGLTWWLGDAVGVLALAPVIVLFAERPSPLPERGRRLELGLLLAASLLVAQAVFTDLLPIAPQRYAIEFVCLPVMVWAAFRFGPREGSAVMLVLAAIAIPGTLRGYGPFAREQPSIALLLVQGCIGVASATTLSMAAAVRQQRRAHLAVQEAQERVRALERDQAAQQMLVRTLEHFPAMIWRCAVDGNCDYVNQQWLAFTGRRLEQERGAGWLEPIHPDDREACRAAWDRAFRQRQAFEREYRLRRKDGEYRWVEDHGRPLTGSGGEFAGFIGGAFDVTERKRHEEAKTRFIANAAHELRTPVASMVGLAELLGGFHRTLGREQFEEYSRLLEEQGMRLRRLITSLLDLSRVEQGLDGLERRPVPVANVTRRALEAAPPPAGTTLQLQVPEELTALTDGLCLEQVLVNLLTNAWRYGGRAVAVEAAGSAQDVVLVVRDDGAGVPQELAPHLFEPFARGPAARGADGSGLGLAIARGMVQALGGAIWYEPDLPRGSRFVVRLPRAA